MSPVEKPPAAACSPDGDGPARRLALSVSSIQKVNASPTAFEFLLLFFPHYITFHLQNLLKWYLEAFSIFSLFHCSPAICYSHLVKI